MAKTDNFQFHGEKSKYPNQIRFMGVQWSSRHYREYHLHLHSHEGEFAGKGKYSGQDHRFLPKRKFRPNLISSWIFAAFLEYTRAQRALFSN